MYWCVQYLCEDWGKLDGHGNNEEKSARYGRETWVVFRAIITILRYGMHFSSMGLPPTQFNAPLERVVGWFGRCTGERRMLKGIPCSEHYTVFISLVPLNSSVSGRRVAIFHST